MGEHWHWIGPLQLREHKCRLRTWSLLSRGNTRRDYAWDEFYAKHLLVRHLRSNDTPYSHSVGDANGDWRWITQARGCAGSVGAALHTQRVFGHGAQLIMH